MGLPEKEVRSHNVRNEKGIVCCPTVKSHECRNCGKCGHFDKFCVVKVKGLAETASRMVSLFASSPAKTMPVSIKVGTSNAFTALACDSSDEDKEQVKNVVKPPVAKKNWADYSDDEDEEELHPNVTRRKHQDSW
jgi:hypothetical protein